MTRESQTLDHRVQFHSKSARDGRHKAGRAAFGLSCVARFEQLACIFASCGALLYGKISASMKCTSPVANGLAISLARSGGWEVLVCFFRVVADGSAVSLATCYLLVKFDVRPFCWTV